MNRKLRIAIVALLCLAVAFSAVGQTKEQKSKVLNKALVAKPKPFDPATATDLYTNTVSGDIFEGLLQYKFLADDYELEPLVAVAMPSVSSDNLTYTFKLRKDAFFYDPTGKVFKGKKGRAVTSKDYAFSLRRLADPANKSGGWWLFDGFIAGLNEWAEAAKASGKADYNASITGVQTPDDTTLVIKLTKPYPQILYCFAMGFTFPVAKEAVDILKDDWQNYPIGTGPYYLDPDETILGTQYVMKMNPTWHGGKYPSGADIGSRAKVQGMDKDAGKDLPFASSVNYMVIEENAPRWLKFMAGEIDTVSPPKENFAQAIVDNKLTPEMEKKGVTLDINSSLDLTYDFFNMDDPVWGAKNPNGKYLRQAVQLTVPVDKIITLMYNGRAVPAQTVIPPGLGGYDPGYKNPYARNDPEAAKALIAKAGYKYVDGKAIGTDGKQLSLNYESSGNSTLSREWAEFYQKYLGDVGIKAEIFLQDWPTFLSKVDNHQAQFGGMGWGADYPDAQNFLQLLYGPNKAPGPNSSNYDNPKFNDLYDKVAVMQQSPERNKLYTQLAQIAVEDAAMIVKTHRSSYALINPWAKNRFFRDIGQGYSKYQNIDLTKK